MDGRELIEKLKVITPQTGHPFWTQACSEMIRWLQENDPESFLDCPILRQTMVFDSDTVAEYELSQLPDRIRSVLRTDRDTGKPLNNSIHQAYHIHMWEKTTHKQLCDLNTIFEFGAGYGELCRLIYELGFEGSYIINDFMAMSLLQQFYLTNEWFFPKVSWENEYVTKVFDLPPCDLFIALWSLSETPLDFRQQYLDINARSCLIAYSLEFMGIDNRKFFAEFDSRRITMNSSNSAIAQLEYKHRYLIEW